MTVSSSFDKGENGPFCRLINDVQRGRKPSEALFEDELYRRKALSAVRAHRLNHEDSEDLLGDVNLRVWRGLAEFVPDYTLEYGGLFAWVRSITRNRRLDTLPDKVEFASERPEELPIVDQKVDLDKQVLSNELAEEFQKCVNSMTMRERLAFTCIVMLRLPSRTAAVILTSAGFACSHTAVLTWASEALKRYFPKAEEDVVSKLERKPNKRARPRTEKVDEISSSKKAAES